MKKVIFLSGLPGVGKSTLARKIANKEGGSVLDIDKIKREVVDPSAVSSTIDPPEVRWMYYERGFEEILRLFKSGASTIVVDEVFHLRALRERLEVLCGEAGITTIWVEVRCGFEEVRRRLLANPRSGHILSTDEALEMYSLFAEIFEGFPPDKENHLIFDSEGMPEVDCLGI